MGDKKAVRKRQGKGSVIRRFEPSKQTDRAARRGTKRVRGKSKEYVGKV